MDLLTSLGVNSTLAIQMGVFLVVYVVLKNVLFDAYFKAYIERNNRTVGQTELAEKYVTQTRELEARFAAKATEVNDRFKILFDKTRGEANKEYDRMITDARMQSKTLVDQARITIQKDMESAGNQLKSEVATVSKLISQKLIGKDLIT
jgi:F-type H+-transporting ATPase subunit b